MIRILLLVTILIINLIILAIHTVGATQNEECPEGTYNIGIYKTDEPLCKIIPTGCPHGDSIPMEKCNTFETPEDQTILVPVEQEPVVMETEGK